MDANRILQRLNHFRQGARDKATMLRAAAVYAPTEQEQWDTNGQARGIDTIAEDLNWLLADLYEEIRQEATRKEVA